MRRFLPRTAKTAAATSAPEHRAPFPSPEPAPKHPRIDHTIGVNSDIGTTEEGSASLDPLVLKRLRKGFEREVRNLVSAAKQNEVVMSKFNFERACSNKKQRDNNNITERTWMDGIPRMAVSADGVPLLIDLPGAIKEGSTLIEFVDGLGGKLPKCAGADKEGRGRVNSYKQVAGQIAGLFKMTKAWHAIGHNVPPHDDPTVASHILKSGRNFSASLALISQLHLISYRVDAMLQYGDEAHFEACKKLRAEAEKRHKFLKVIGSDDPLVMEGREIMYNRQTPLHPDKSDHKRGWAVLVVVGPFTGGALHIPCLNLHMSYTNGTMIMIRGKVLPHEVEAFSNGFLFTRKRALPVNPEMTQLGSASMAGVQLSILASTTTS
ncbi:hypothetical protein B0H17DRAFT_1146949 [Mycena rosella]|uniref:Uncharacterized protein n=1 Tax=Mycena rosella TaxID=1033263 RepID=A0AAD7G0B4_MYCRO|nr:hypothetical protein B0H17DRAFT_1146949 [Mycena rosella]